MADIVIDLVVANVNAAAPLPGIPLFINLVPANANAAGVPYASLSLGEPVQNLTPAKVLARANPMTPVLSGGNITVTLLPANVRAGGYGYYSPIVGTVLQGDPFTYPYEINNTGSATYVMNSMTKETGEPTTAFTKSMWLRYYSPGPVALTLAASGGSLSVEVFEGTTLTSLVLLGSSASGLTVNIGTGYTYIRLSTSTNISIVLSWSFVTRTIALLEKTLTPELAYTPGVVRVAVQGARSNEEVLFTWSPAESDLIPDTVPRPITLASVRADVDGRILVGSLQIPITYAGSYEILAVGTVSGYQTHATFAVTHDPILVGYGPEE